MKLTMCALALSSLAGCVMTPTQLMTASNDELCFQARGMVNRDAAQRELYTRNVNCNYAAPSPQAQADNTALILQLLRPQQPPPLIVPQQQVCRSRWVGNQVETICQ